MSTPDEQTIRDWFDKKFTEWQQDQLKLGPKRKMGVGQFAKFLGLKTNTLNNYRIRGSQPEGDKLDLIGERYLDIYDLLGLPRPNPWLKTVNKYFESLSEAQQRRLAEEAERAYEVGAKKKGGDDKPLSSKDSKGLGRTKR